MYIAFKWLAGLAFAMWIAMCIIDAIKGNKEIVKKGMNTIELPYRNKSTPSRNVTKNGIHKHKIYSRQYQQYDATVLHYMMFFAGAVAVFILNRKNEIITYTRDTFAKIDMRATGIELKHKLNEIRLLICTALKQFRALLLKLTCRILEFLNTRRLLKTETTENNKLSNLLLLKKVKEFVEERKRLGQLLIAAVHENKNIRLQYQLETMAKNRLVRHIENTQKQSKENRSRFVNFQNLYLVTHQENIFLKARVQKLTRDKENLEKDLMAIINEIYKSKNSELKDYCCRFIVRSRENFINADISAEVRKFLEKSRAGVTPDQPKDGNKAVNDLPPYFASDIVEFSTDATVPLVSNAPKLKGLPGECIWTVKDKDGIIEKLYEYDFESDLDSGDTIRRIREYSVYHDKDCLLDFSRSRSVVTEVAKYPANHRFLTGSKAFQKFLQNNNNVVPTSRPSTPTRSLLCVTSTMI